MGASFEGVQVIMVRRDDVEFHSRGEGRQGTGWKSAGEHICGKGPEQRSNHGPRT
jgi:hypothetical protein